MAINDEVSLLSEEQLKQYKFFNLSCSATDFACLSGCFIYKDPYSAGASYYLKNNMKNEICKYGSGCNESYDRLVNSQSGIRPCIKVSNIQELKKNAFVDKYDNIIVMYGEFPQYIVEDVLSKKLEEEYNYGNLKKTGKTYTINKNRDNNKGRFEPEYIEEYEYNDVKYVRMIAKEREDALSNNKELSIGEIAWIEVKPLKWYLDEKTSTLVARHSIMGGISYSNSKDCNYEDSDLFLYLNKYFIKEMNVSKKNQVDELVDNINKIIEDNKNKIDDPGFQNLIIEIRTNMSNLLQEYNDNLDKLISANNKGITLGFGIKDENDFKRDIIFKLDDYKSRLMGYILPKNKYLQLINILKLNQNSDNINDDLLDDLKKVKYAILPTLGNARIVKEYNDFIDGEIKILFNLSLSGDVSDLETLKNYFRAKLMPYLHKIYIAVQNKNYLNDLVEDALEGKVKESNNKSKGIYLTIYDACCDLIRKIKINGNNDELNLANNMELKLNEVINSDLDYSDILERLKEYYKEISRIEIDMNTRLEKIESINSMKSRI